LPKLGAVAVAIALTATLVAGCGPDKPDQLVASAKAYLAKNDQKAATIQLKNALQADPKNAEARYLLGVSLAESGDYVSAEKEFRRALEYRYPTEQVYPRLARSLIATGEFKKAAAELGMVKLADPTAEAAVKTALAEAHLARRWTSARSRRSRARGCRLSWRACQARTWPAVATSGQRRS
jgi:Flp pilus assembly protein TadD